MAAVARDETIVTKEKVLALRDCKAEAGIGIDIDRKGLCFLSKFSKVNSFVSFESLSSIGVLQLFCFEQVEVFS